MKYVRRSEEVIEAEQWKGWPKEEYRPDHIEPYELQPNVRINETHMKCKQRWLDHGTISSKYLKGRHPWDDDEVICPGDYLVTEPTHTGVPQYTVVHGPIFEKVYREHESERLATILSATAWERMNRMEQDETIRASQGTGVLIVPDEMLQEHGQTLT